MQPRPSPQAAPRAGTFAASSRRDRADRVRPCAFREWKPAQLRLKWASNASVRRKDAACECLSLSEVRLGEGQPVAALSVDNRGLSHERARGMWMVRPNRRGFWRAQPSRTPPPRYGARRERAMARLDRHRCERFQIEDNFCRVRSDPRHYLKITPACPHLELSPSPTRNPSRPLAPPSPSTPSGQVVGNKYNCHSIVPAKTSTRL